MDIETSLNFIANQASLMGHYLMIKEKGKHFIARFFGNADDLSAHEEMMQKRINHDLKTHLDVIHSFLEGTVLTKDSAIKIEAKDKDNLIVNIESKLLGRFCAKNFENKWREGSHQPHYVKEMLEKITHSMSLAPDERPLLKWNFEDSGQNPIYASTVERAIFKRAIIEKPNIDLEKPFWEKDIAYAMTYFRSPTLVFEQSTHQVVIDGITRALHSK